jgi:hypothetical protein
MAFADFFDRLKHAPARPHNYVWLHDPTPYEGDAPPGYFQVRLTDMSLTDDRRWLQEIVPATFFLIDFDYDSTTVRQPYFVSNQLLSMMPAGVDLRKLRVHFKDTLVAGPVPYAGGEVGLFVGLFQSAIDDKRAALFSVFETLFGSIELGMLTPYVKLADKLSEQVLLCLGGADIKCLLAERRVIGQHALPERGYLAFLSGRDGQIDTAGLEVRDGVLQRAGVPVQDVDYCLIRVEHLAFRNDYSKMPFNEVLARARTAKRAGRAPEAQALLLECAREIDACPDLSTAQKSALIESSAAALYGTPILAEAPTRDGMPSPIWAIQNQAQQALGIAYNEKLLSPSFQRISDLATRLSQSPPSEGPLAEAEILAHLKAASKTPAPPPPNELVRALAAGSVIG